MTIKRNNNLHKALTRRQLLRYGIFGTAAAGISPGLWLSGCSKGRRAKKPNIILISIDTTRSDHCSIHNYQRDTTPNLRTCAHQGASFKLAYSPTASTMPSHATMFTSLYPVEHGVIRNGINLRPENYTLAERLNADGYQTAAVVSLFLLDRKFGFAKGFSFYDDRYKLSKATIGWKSWEGHDVEGGFDQRADDTTNKAVSWLKNKRDPDNPFFLFMHYYDPHFPYVPPKQFLPKLRPDERNLDPAEQLILRHDGEITFVDYELGILFAKLKEMGLEEDTLVVVTSDHGEGLFEHSHMAHAIYIYEEAVRVPLVFRWPGHIVPGQTFDAPVELLSLAPTILDLAGIERDGCPFEGQSLASALRGKSKLDINRPVFLYREYYEGHQQEVFYLTHKKGKPQVVRGKRWVKGEKFGIRVRNWKYIESEGEDTRELFDLATDPREVVNVYSKLPKRAAEMTNMLQEWKQVHISGQTDPGTISPEDLKKLKSLGYLK